MHHLWCCKDEDMKPEEDRGLDLESTEPPPLRPIPNYNTKFITTHKNPCRIAKFSPDGTISFCLIYPF